MTIGANKPSLALLRALPWASALLLLLVSTLSWATVDANADSSYLTDFETGVAAFDARDYASADIHLKKALQKRPDHLPSRLLLGRTQLHLGRAPEAEKELLIALRQGAAKDRVVVPLGNALLLQRKYKDILERITIDGISRAGRYEVLTLRGRAQQEMGDLESAHLSFDQAISYDTTMMEAYLGKSRTFSAGGDYVNAEAWIDLALERDPTSEELIYEKANLRRRRGDNDKAMDLYDAVLKENPDHMRARLGRASLSLSLGELEQASEDSEYVHTRIPQDPDASLLYAQALTGLGQADKAKEVLHVAADSLSQIKDEEILAQPGLLRVAALISLQLGVADRANFYLDRYVELVPHEMRIRVVSARLKLQVGDAAGAVRVLEPPYKSGVQDADLISLMGEAYLATERFDEAQVALEKAAKLQPDLPQVNTRLAFSKLGDGVAEGVWEELSAAHSASEGASATAGIVMTIMLVRAADYDQALKIATELLERQPKNPILLNLLGIVSLSRNETSVARKSFEQALEVYPDFIPAMYNLGLVELEARNPEAAEEWFRRILKLKPQQVQALVALAEINVSRRNYQDAVALLEKATVMKTEDIAPHMRLIEIHLRMGDIAEAQRQGAILTGRHPENPQLLELMGQVEVAAGNREKAISHLRSASHFADANGATQIRIAEKLSALRDYQAAKTPLVLALDTDQRMLAQEKLVDLFLRESDTKSARVQAKQVRKEDPDSALGYVLEARILQHEGNYEQAIAQYEAAIGIKANRAIVLDLYGLYDRLGRQTEGIKLLEKWAREHPEDSIAQRILALGYLRTGKREQALAMLEDLAKSRAKDSLVLASLAQLYLQDGNPQARAVAERALEAAPNWAIALDTYGWVLVQAGEAEAGLKYLREAITRDSNPLIRYHLAAALHDLGRDSEALTELEIIFRLSPEPPWIESARTLHETITQSE